MTKTRDKKTLLSVSLWEVLASWRNCFRNPAFLLVSALTLGLGVGSCVATFALIDDFILSPPPFANPSRLAMLGPAGSSFLTTMSPQQYQQVPGLRDFEAVGAASIVKFWNVAGTGQPVLAPGQPVDRSFLAVLGTTMAQGRNFAPEEDRPNGPAVVIISRRLWLHQFGGASDILGKVISLDGNPAAIVGVLPQSFQLGQPVDILVPLALPEHSRDRGNHLIVVGRLAPGFSFQQASADLNTLMYSKATELRIKPSDHLIFSATSLWRDLSGASRPVVLMFFAFSICLLALVAANLSNLLLLRSVARSRDIAVRSALGADSFRLGLPSFSEGVLVGVFGCGIGLALAANGLNLIDASIPTDWMNSVQGAHLGARAYAFALLLGTAVPMLSALLAVRRARMRNAAQGLVAGSRIGWNRGQRRTGQILLISQVCLATALLIIALTFSHSLSRLSNVDLGLKAGRVVTFTINPLRVKYPDAASVQGFVRNAIQRLRQLPSTGGIVASTNLPVGPPFAVPIKLPEGQTSFMQYRPVTPGFFEVFGISQKEGRDFNDLDKEGTESVAIVNMAFARRYFKEGALGNHIILGITPNNGPMRVIGVVGDVRQSGPQSPAEPAVYVPLAQVSNNLLQDMRQFLALHFSLDVNGDPASAQNAIRAALLDVAPDQAIADLGPFSETVVKATATQRLDLKLVGILSLLALVLSNVGLYSVASVSMASQHRDLGIQTALGAAPMRLLRRLLGQVMRQILTGLAMGVFGGWIASRYLRNIVVGLDFAGLTDFLPPIAFLIALGIIVCLRPAWRAARVNPISALREE